MSNSGLMRMSTETTAFPRRRRASARCPLPAKRSRKTRLSPGAALRIACRRCARTHAPVRGATLASPG
eukprot:4720919-Heterocapsa_arctica.AAC.1